MRTGRQGGEGFEGKIPELDESQVFFLKRHTKPTALHLRKTHSDKSLPAGRPKQTNTQGGRENQARQSPKVFYFNHSGLGKALEREKNTAVRGFLTHLQERGGKGWKKEF